MKNSRYALTGVLIAGILIAAVLIIKKYNPVGAVSFSTEQGAKFKGPAGAPVQIVEYSDFECPACMKAEIVIQKILSDPDFAGKIQFTYRHFPLSGHRWSGLAHQAAECAHGHGKFWEYHDRLYKDQALWSAMDSPMESFLLYAKELAISVDVFGVCLANPEVRHRVLEEKKMGENVQIRSTPTFFINGERLVGMVELELRGPEMIRNILGLEPKLIPSEPEAPILGSPEAMISENPPPVSEMPAPDLSPSPEPSVTSVPLAP